MGRTSGRIVPTQSVDELLTPAAKVYRKHDLEGANSPLLKPDGIQWSETGPAIGRTSAKHKEAEEICLSGEFPFIL